MTAALTGGVRHPKIYAYTTDAYENEAWIGPREGKGLLKVGYTDLDVDQRIYKQLHGVKMPTPTAYEVQVVEAAIADDGRAFLDHDVHAALRRAGVHRREGEWYECTAAEVQAAIAAVKSGARLQSLRPRATFELRPEQEAAVERTAAYFTAHADGSSPPHFLWNAKMRFGKTFTTYQLAQRMGWTRVLVLTYKPAVETAWREDLEGHADFAGWRFKGKEDAPPDLGDESPLVWFASFQDVLGSDDDGNPKAKNGGLYEAEWDAVVIDEYHFGAWRDAARGLYVGDPETGSSGDTSEKAELDTPDLDEDFTENLEGALPLRVSNYLYLSGTPFRALTQGEFLEDQVYNWTYSDEQREKAAWTGHGKNPYAALPKMYLLAYEMPEALREVALNNLSEFSLTEFFRTEKTDDGPPRFIHESEVQKWLDLLRGQEITGLWANVSSRNRPPLPYEDTNLLAALQHTVWYLPSVDACFAMRGLLTAQHNTFYRDYQVVVAAGAKAGLGKEALPPVEQAIGKVPQERKTITLSCGKLMTGVTVPAWAGIFMLRELKSPESYFQAAFRVQSPWKSALVNTAEGGEDEVVHKEHCYVLDFAPNRALRQIVDYATRLRADTAAERNDEAAIDEFMEFLPVLSFDGYSMSQLHAADVLDYLTNGISSSMLARRWNSPELLALDMRAMEALLANPDLLASLEQIEMFRNITDDLTAMISTNKELRQKTLAKEKLSGEEKARKDDAAKRRDNLKKRLQRFITRIPAFMYLTDDREKAIRDIVTQLEPQLFERVTGLTLADFEQLVNAGVFNDSKMNDAVWKFRTFEEPSLHYGESEDTAPRTVGGWTLRRDEQFALLVDTEVLRPGDTLTGASGAQAMITEDYGILVGGIRQDGPDAAAKAATNSAVTDGWTYWSASTGYGDGSLAELHALVA
ncbi:GIY-YIG nuclease family protein [Modestobacter sp. VKM Ac-2979]|uniref:GIY-YIG nuclease family protein n=1 Tax=unclassified Modestobacter TaxID=2643866 RepID=UPI0022AB9F37|nr:MULTISPECIES: GIY-YIG nuclease family protein [unclassified Modestobacter]MCZ2813829.1 GIY-YIG nuclease family protein [Modestobacter sp. VKM Ac-2979]MCZ2844196.1 GIY-YIG nuclease family protein [Modestobacter sp. VKM Ac-2980]